MVNEIEKNPAGTTPPANDPPNREDERFESENPSPQPGETTGPVGPDVKPIDRSSAPVPENEPRVSFVDEAAETNEAAENAEDAEQPEPNIIFIKKRKVLGENGWLQSVPADPPESIRDGVNFYKLPTAAEQREGFYHPSAAAIIRAFPDAYKAFVRKGEK